MVVMLEDLCGHLLEKSDLYFDEMAIFLWDEFDVQSTISTIGRALSSGLHQLNITLLDAALLFNIDYIFNDAAFY
jgi:hypothetical protein